MSKDNDGKGFLFVVIVGNFSEGYSVVGPFNSFDEASDYDSQFGGHGWVNQLLPANKPR